MRGRLALLAMALTLGAAPSAHAQSLLGSRSAACDAAPSTAGLFTGTARSFRQLRSRESLTLFAVGALAAAGTHTADREVTEDFTRSTGLRQTFKSGAVVGGTPLQLASAFATYGLGRALHKPCVASLGADLVQAQLVGQALTIGIKQATQRARPEGSGLSFPSGHTASAFASATVLQRHFGWKVGVPAYAVASYVAASRVQMKRHYASDVVFGAAVGLVAGRSVTLGHERFVFGPTASPHGAGAALTWVGRK